MINIDEILKACQLMLSTVREKSEIELNPLLIRIQYVINEMESHFLVIASNIEDIKTEKYHWSILYREGDILDEMATLIHNTTPVSIRTEVDYIKQQLITFTSMVVQTFGKRESLYIITPKFQELAGLW